MPATLSPEERERHLESIRMFEVIVAADPDDVESWDIIKESHAKLDDQPGFLKACKSLARAYVRKGKLTMAILEYEDLARLAPSDPEVTQALAQIETLTSGAAHAAPPPDPEQLARPRPAESRPAPGAPPPAAGPDHGRTAMRRCFVDAKLVSAADFDRCWIPPSPVRGDHTELHVPLIHAFEEQNLLPAPVALRALCDRSRLAYLPLERYELDSDLARLFTKPLCRRYCVLPFDRMTKNCILLATAAPFDEQAAADFQAKAPGGARLIWYLAPPKDLLAALRRIFR